ncbi:MAG: CAP domain-containing protein [Lachnospiraceae bacterium]|nr:CAP domain-containing protein [Lachnospiraceae bacterium]
MKRIFRSLISLLLSVLLVTLPMATVVVKADRAKGSSTIGTVDTVTSNVAFLNNQMLSKINGLRESQGVADLALDATLNSYAAIRSEEAATKWSHTRPDGSQGYEMIAETKWRGENLSYIQYPGFSYSQADQAAAADVMFDNLVASPTHYDNMVFGSFTKIGIRTSVLGTGDGSKLTTAYMFSS